MVMLHAPETTDTAVDRIFREQTDTALNEVAVRHVDAALREWLGEDRARITKEIELDAAKQIRRRYIKARTPRMVGGQLGLFQPHFLIPLGKGRYAWMDAATREQVIEWKAVLLRAFGRTQATHDERLRQIDERLDRWGRHPTFGQVERVEFGWAAADFRYGASDRDDEDEEDEDD